MIRNDKVFKVISPNPTNPPNTMSSNIRIPKTCEFCQNEFVARKTNSKTCSDDCAKRLYKLNQRNKKITAGC